MHLYYKDDDAVEEDEEIQAFVKDVHNFGMQGFESCGECVEMGVLAKQQCYNPLPVFLQYLLQQIYFFISRVSQVLENP